LAWTSANQGNPSMRAIPDTRGDRISAIGTPRIDARKGGCLVPSRLFVAGALLPVGLLIATPTATLAQNYGGWPYGAPAYRPAYVGRYPGYYPRYYGPRYYGPRYYFPIGPIVPRYVYAPPPPVVYVLPPPPPPMQQCSDGSTIPAGAYCPAPPEPAPAPAVPPPSPAIPPPTPERG